jgi:hypothetical protein
MKNLIKGLAFLCMLSLCSCTKVLYTQKQVMSRYKTQKEVLSKFGIPTEKRISEDSTEEWLYKYNKKRAFNDHSVNELTNTKTANVTNFTLYKRYVIFSMDKQGNVVSWKNVGMSLEERKKNTVGTIALVVGGVAFVTLMAVAAASDISIPYSFGGGD